MDEPARKRRRTVSLAPGDRLSSSPLKQPPRRPSFASPTKASLARFNPDMIARRSSSPYKPPPRGVHSRQTIGRPGEDSEIQIADRGNSAPPNIVEEEEELPPTSPTAMLPDKPRRGMLFSSPSKRPPAGRRSSILEPRDPNRELRKRRSVSIAGAEGDENAERGQERKRERLDPEVEAKKREREILFKELRELEGDVKQCTETINTLHGPETPKMLEPAERDKLIFLINKLSDSHPTAEDEPPPISNLLSSFLPFTVQPIAPPRPAVPEDEYIPSHRPVELDDPLPYLSLFTPFTFASRLTLPDSATLNSLPIKGPANDYQTHTITVTGPQKLLVATIQATIDTTTHTVIHLHIPRLSHLAESELGLFIRKRAREDRDLSCVCWALQSYYTLAKKRAEFWWKCENAFPNLIPARANEDSSGLLGENSKRKYKENVERPDPSTMSRRDVLRHLGRDVLVLQDKHVLLKVCWRIGFDWTGEADSTVQVEAAVPSVWSEADSDKSLKKIPQAFDALVESRGVFEATRIMIALLFTDH